VPLTYRDRGTSGTQLEVLSGNEAVAFLWKGVLSATAGKAVHWHWTFYAGPARDPQQHGTADTIDEAKIKIETTWQAWLRSAKLREE
jgi:hypothetical protein